MLCCSAVSLVKNCYQILPVPDKDEECDIVTEKSIPSASSCVSAITHFENSWLVLLALTECIAGTTQKLLFIINTTIVLKIYINYVRQYGTILSQNITPPDEIIVGGCYIFQLNHCINYKWAIFGLCHCYIQ